MAESKRAARLLDLTDSAIKKRLRKINMNSAMSKELGRGGVQIEIRPGVVAAGSTGQIHNIQREHTHNDMMQFTGKQREEANFKALIVENYQKAQNPRMTT